MTMYEIVSLYRELFDAYLAADTEEEQDEILGRLDACGDDLNNKAEAYARFMRNVEGEIEQLKAEEKRLSAQRKRRESLVRNLKLGIESAMSAIGVKKLETSVGKWSIQKNPWSCEIVDEFEVPERFKTYRTEVDIDKKAMIEEFKATGECFDGVRIEQREGVRFR